MIPLGHHSRPAEQGRTMSGRALAFALALLGIAGLAAEPAAAQKSGGILRLYHRDSPASLSIHEEATISAIAPAMALFNNLVLFDQHEKRVENLGCEDNGYAVAQKAAASGIEAKGAELV